MNKRMLTRLRVMAAALLILTFGLAVTVNATQNVGANVAIPVALSGTASAFDCSNSPGPWITFEDALTMGGMNVQLVFRNQRTDGAPHERTEDVEVAKGIAVGETIVIPKQPSHDFAGGTRTGVGGNPFIGIQLVDDSGNPLTSEVFLGRCVQGDFPTNVTFSAPAFAQAVVSVMDCTNNPGASFT